MPVLRPEMELAPRADPEAALKAGEYNLGGQFARLSRVSVTYDKPRADSDDEEAWIVGEISGAPERI